MIWLDNARIIAILAVVFLHVAGSVVTESGIGSGYWWYGNLYDSSVRWCIPVFVMISGALLLNPEKIECLRAFYAKRASRILIPVLFWSAVFLLRWALNSTGEDRVMLALESLKRLLSGKPHDHMWFLYMIIFLYLFTPFLRKIVANSTRRELVIFVVATFLISVINGIATIKFGEPKLFINWFLSYIPYYVLGYLVRTDERNFPNMLLLAVAFFSILLTAFGCFALANYKNLVTGLYFYDYLSITVVPMSVSVIYLLKAWKKPIFNEIFTKKLAALTLGVYLFHPIILDPLIAAGRGPMSFHPALSIPAITLFVFLLSLGVSWTISKIPYLNRTI
jgi:surface polysaccharide O-acyltransferase-like enzyme